MLHINFINNLHQYSLDSMVNLIPLAKMSLNWFPVFTQHDAPEHKLCILDIYIYGLFYDYKIWEQDYWNTFTTF